MYRPDGVTTPNWKLVDRNWAYQPHIEECPTFLTEFLNLFKQYKINYVKLEFVKRFDTNVLPKVVDTAEQGILDDANIPYLLYVRDATAVMGDITVAGHYQSAFVDKEKLLEYPNVHRVQLGKNFSIGFKPSFMSLAYQTPQGAATRPRRGWLNITDSRVPHFGLYYHIDGVESALGSDVWKYWQYHCYVTYYMSFRGLR